MILIKIIISSFYFILFFRVWKTQSTFKKWELSALDTPQKERECHVGLKLNIFAIQSYTNYAIILNITEKSDS